MCACMYSYVYISVCLYVDRTCKNACVCIHESGMSALDVSVVPKSGKPLVMLKMLIMDCTLQEFSSWPLAINSI